MIQVVSMWVFYIYWPCTYKAPPGEWVSTLKYNHSVEGKILILAPKLLDIG